MEINDPSEFKIVSFNEVETAWGKKTVEQDDQMVVTYEKKLASLDDLINFKTKLVELSDKNVDKLILSDRSIKLILDNFAESCKASSIKLGPFDKLLKNESENGVKLDSDNDFIKICKLMYQIIINKNKQVQNLKGSILFVLGKAGSYYFSNFTKWLARIKNFLDYISNIENINSEDEDFRNFKKLVTENQLIFQSEQSVPNIVCKNKNDIKGRRLDIEMLGKLEEFIQQTNKTNQRKFLIALDIVTAIGFIISTLSAINYFALGFIEMSSTAAIVSMTVPGGVGLLCLVLCIILLKTYYTNDPKIKVPYKLGDIEPKVEEVIDRNRRKYLEDDINSNNHNYGNQL